MSASSVPCTLFLPPLTFVNFVLRLRTRSSAAEASWLSMANASLRVRTSFRGTRGLAASPGITLSPTPTHRRHPHLDPATMSNPLESLCSSWCVATQQRRGVEWCGLARVVSVVWNKKQDTSLPRQQMSMPHCMRCRCTSGAPNHSEGRPSKQSQFSHTHFVSQFLFSRNRQCCTRALSVLLAVTTATAVAQRTIS